MHAVRRQAHRVASSTGSGPNYNPFARVRSREPSEDVENGVPSRRMQSESNIQQAGEHSRHASTQRAVKDFGMPDHADTAPATSPTTTSRADHALNEKEAENDHLPNGGPSNSNESSDPSDRTAVNDSGLTKRAKFKGIFRKHHDAEQPHETEDDADKLSVEERKRRAHKRKIPIGAQIRFVLLSSWINILLIFVPIGFAVNYSHKVNAVGVFVINFVAIVPLAAMLSNATEELAIRVGETLGGLLNATFGNAVELIVAIQALIQGQVVIVKTSLIGSMLSNLLLVMGMSFFLGGLHRTEQFFNVTVAQTAASLLALCVASLIIPTVFHNMLADDNGTVGDAVKNNELSRATALILLFVYGCYLFFQLKTHVAMYNAPSQKVPKRKSSKIEEGTANKGVAAIGAGTAASVGGGVNAKNLIKADNMEGEDDEEEFEEPSLTPIGALVTLAISTTLVAFCSEFMVSSIDGLTSTGKISTTFVGLILLPIVGNAAEHATAVTVAMKDKMDLAIGVAVGSSMQIALLVLPLSVVLGWILRSQCMNLYFDTFQIATLFVSVLLVNYLIQDGKSHWLEGVLLMASYIIIAVAAWFYPDINENSC